MGRKILLLASLFVLLIAVKPQGLAFKGSGFNLLQRTSFNVFSESQPTFQDSLILSFNLKINLKSVYWGYITSIQDVSSGLNVSLLYTINNNERNFTLNYNNSSGENQINYPLKGAKDFRIKMKFNFKGNSLQLSINQDKYYIVNIAQLKKSISPIIYFGKNNQRLDVPDFSINTLIFKDSQKRIVFNLKEYEGTKVYDSNGKNYGKVENPIWLIKDSYHWEKIFSHKSTDYTGYIYFPEKKIFQILSDKSIVSHNFETNSTNCLPISNKIKFKIEQGMNMYFPKLNKLNFYEIRHSGSNETNVAELLNVTEFISKNKNPFPSRMHHHAVYTDTVSNLFYTFGGFGNNKYYNQLYCYNPKTDNWNIYQLKGDKINPRYFCSMGSPDNRKLYLFGGKGNERGSHTMEREYYYDLNEIDLTTKTVKKKWEYKNHEKNFISARNIVFLKETPGFFYSISYTEYEAHTYAKLMKWSIADGSMRIVGDSVPVCSESILTNMCLAVDNKSSKLYCVVQEYVERKSENTISVYQITTPPVSISELKKQNQTLFKTIGIFIIETIVIFAVFFVIIYFIRRRNKVNVNQSVILGQIQDNAHVADIERHNSIYLFGEFTIYDKNGMNISHLFSNKMRQLFLFILIKSYNGEGVTSDEINKTLWPDKDSIDCKNLRGVMINKIRTLLEDIDGITLNFSNAKYILKLETPIYCDFKDFNTFIYSKSNGNNHMIEDNIFNLTQIIKRGSLFKSGNVEQLETVILEYENKIITILVVELDFYFKKHQYQTVIQLSIIAQYFDKLNVKTLTYCVQSLNKLKRENDMLKSYAFYCLEYKKQNNSEFSIGLNQLLNQEL